MKNEKDFTEYITRMILLLAGPASQMFMPVSDKICRTSIKRIVGDQNGDS